MSFFDSDIIIQKCGGQKPSYPPHKVRDALRGFKVET